MGQLKPSWSVVITGRGPQAHEYRQPPEAQKAKDQMLFYSLGKEQSPTNILFSAQWNLLQTSDLQNNDKTYVLSSHQICSDLLQQQ